MDTHQGLDMKKRPGQANGQCGSRASKLQLRCGRGEAGGSARRSRVQLKFGGLRVRKDSARGSERQAAWRVGGGRGRRCRPGRRAGRASLRLSRGLGRGVGAAGETLNASTSYRV
uniref:Uncharacterized protein n=1 Tax=Sus scrofa TaxID=9823 RepID=A0A8D1UEW9_PIG